MSNILFRKIIYECMGCDEPDKKFQEYIDFILDNYQSYVDNDTMKVPFRDNHVDNFGRSGL